MFPITVRIGVRNWTLALRRLTIAERSNRAVLASLRSSKMGPRLRRSDGHSSKTWTCSNELVPAVHIVRAMHKFRMHASATDETAAFEDSALFAKARFRTIGLG